MNRDKILFADIRITKLGWKQHIFNIPTILILLASFVFFNGSAQGRSIEQLVSVLPVASAKFSSRIVTIDWDKHFGGKDKDDVNSMVQTEDGGLVIAG